MSRHAWSLHAFQMILPDEQLDLFACREVRLHLVARQLELAGAADRTLCGSLLPAHPRWLDVERAQLKDSRLCTACMEALAAHRRGSRNDWSPS